MTEDFSDKSIVTLVEEQYNGQGQMTTGYYHGSLSIFSLSIVSSLISTLFLPSLYLSRCSKTC